MSFAPGRRSPTRNDGRNSPVRPNLGTKVPLKTFSKNDLLASSPIPVTKGNRNTLDSPKAQMSESQKEYLQSLNGQINHLESEFNELLAVKEAVENAKVTTGEDFNDQKAMLLEQKEMEYLQLRRDRSVSIYIFVCSLVVLNSISVCLI